MYIGLKIDEVDENSIVDHFVQNSLKRLSEKYEDLFPLYDKFDQIESLKWKRPAPPYHITSFFVNRKKENL